MICGVLSGYVSRRLYQTFRPSKEQLYKCTILTALLFPGIAFGIFLGLNVLMAFARSTASVPFLYVMGLALQVLVLVTILSFLGAYIASRTVSTTTEYYPTVTSPVCRSIPAPPKRILALMWGMAMTGLLPFWQAYVDFF